MSVASSLLHSAVEVTKREKLANAKDTGLLEAFYKDTNNQRVDIARQKIGHVDWAPDYLLIIGHMLSRLLAPSPSTTRLLPRHSVTVIVLVPWTHPHP